MPPRLGSAADLTLGRPVAVHPNLSRPVSGRHDRGRRGSECRCRDTRERRGGIDHPEEPAGLEVEVTQLTVLGLAGGLAHGIDSLGDLAALLGRRQSLELERTDLEAGVDTEVVGRDGGGDESGLREAGR